MENKRVHLRIHGSVQGVFFRAQAQRKALELELCGWIRNNSDGSVEVIAEGGGDQLKDMVEWCRVGPPEAVVNKVIEDWESATGEFKEFRIEYI